MTRTNTSRSFAARGAFILSLAFAATAASSAQSAEITAGCFWEILPSAVRDRVIVAYAKGGSAAVDALTIKVDLEMIVPCAGMPTTRAETQELAEQVDVLKWIVPLERASQEYLAAHGYSLLVLDEAWRRLGPADREKVRSAGVAVASGIRPEIGPVAEILSRAADLAGRPVDLAGAEAPRPAAFTEYFLSRATREAVEAQ